MTQRIYCIAMDGEGPTGVEWFYSQSDRDAAMGTTGGELETPFSFDTDETDHNAITDEADDLAWTMDYEADPLPPLPR